MSPGAESFESLYRAYAPGVFRRARQLLNSEADAHDVVSDVFASLFERPEQYAGKSALSSFLYSMTTHACLVRLRNQRRRSNLLEERGGSPLPQTTPASLEVAPDLRRILDSLPEPLGEVAVYYYLDELSHAEIAEILGCSRRTVGNLLARLSSWVREREAHV